jgi:ADP-ribosylglycohydrolase/catechol 2,3-dioxygenase-like lactoylglutathione lyase family enzyme
MPHEETIYAGEYSDDTQLILCSARAILHGREWLKRLAQVELPTWSAYERGGGGATKRAVESLANGNLPWSREIDLDRRRQYFNAGGNGVAMRILPHALKGAHEQSFLLTARAIFLNGICTHGHPRALLGALAYGYAAWQAFRHSGTLPYGYLLELALANSSTWAELPEPSGALADWQDSANEVLDGRLKELWSQTVLEVQRLFVTALSGIKAGALSMDSQVLSELGCFDRTVSGSGTISAVASIYLASKYAPDPQHGVVEAAFSKGADTDTLASMVGALLGTVSGLDWLQTYRNRLQDESYLERLSEQIYGLEPDSGWDETLNSTGTRPKTAIDRFTRGLLVSTKGTSLTLPDGRQALVEHRAPVSTSSNSFRGDIWTLKTADGQTLHVKKLFRSVKEGREQTDHVTTPKRVSPRRNGRFTSKVQAIKLTVRSLEKSRSFYGDVLGLKVKRESKNLVNFGGIISLVPLDYTSEIALPGALTAPTRSILCLETSNIDLCHLRVAECVDAGATAIAEMAGRRFFRCVDPDENVLEIFERLRRSTMSLPKDVPPA